MEVKMLYKTPDYRIGKYLWRVVVWTDANYGAVTEYQWLNEPHSSKASQNWGWRSENELRLRTKNRPPTTLHKIHFNHSLNIDRALLVGMESLLAEWDKAGKTGLQVDDLRAEVRGFKMSSRFGRNTA
jgi:hypothetical protein